MRTESVLWCVVLYSYTNIWPETCCRSSCLHTVSVQLVIFKCMDIGKRWNLEGDDLIIDHYRTEAATVQHVKMCEPVSELTNVL